MVAGARDHPALLDPGADLLGDVQAQSHGLLHEQRLAALQRGELGGPVGERLHADVDGVGRHGVEGLRGVGERGDVEFSGQGGGGGQVRVRHPDHARPAESVQHVDVATGHGSRPDQGDAQRHVGFSSRSRWYRSR